jgi:hypothetical protein
MRMKTNYKYRLIINNESFIIFTLQQMFYGNIIKGHKMGRIYKVLVIKMYPPIYVYFPSLQ